MSAPVSLLHPSAPQSKASPGCLHRFPVAGDAGDLEVHSVLHGIRHAKGVSAHPQDFDHSIRFRMDGLFGGSLNTRFTHSFQAQRVKNGWPIECRVGGTFRHRKNNLNDLETTRFVLRNVPCLIKMTVNEFIDI